MKKKCHIYNHKDHTVFNSLYFRRVKMIMLQDNLPAPHSIPLIDVICYFHFSLAFM
jgi:hypothetical protein